MIFKMVAKGLRIVRADSAIQARNIVYRLTGYRPEYCRGYPDFLSSEVDIIRAPGLDECINTMPTHRAGAALRAAQARSIKDWSINRAEVRKDKIIGNLAKLHSAMLKASKQQQHIQH